MNATPSPDSGFVPVPGSGRDLPTACVLCSHNCALRVDVEGNRITDVRPDPASPMSAGHVCNKGYAIPHYVEHAQRVTHPLRRRPDGSFEEIPWAVAIREIADKLGAIRRESSPRSIGLIGVGGQANHLDGVFAISFLRALGSPWWFNAFAQEKTQHPLVDAWMMDAPPTSFLHADAEHSDYVLMMGTNPLLSNRGFDPQGTIKGLSGSDDRTLVVVDPRRTETARRADRHLRLRPGTDAYLLLGLAAEILRQGLEDRAFLDAHVTGLAELRAALEAVDTAEMARRCGLDEAELSEVAADFARAPSASIFWDLGVEQIPFSTLVAYLIRLVATLTGNLGNRGGMHALSTFSPAAKLMTDRKMHVAPVSGIAGIAALGGMGMFSPNLVPEEIERDHPERIRAVIVEGSNPLLSFADTGRYRDAFAKLDLLVVIEPAMTETARVADYVLPTPTGYEKWEMSTFPKAYPEILAQLRPPVVEGPAEALPEAEIYTRLAEAMGLVSKAPLPLRAAGRLARHPRLGPALQAASAALATALGREKGRTTANLIFWNYRVAGPHLPARALSAVWSLAHVVALTRRRDVLRTFGAELGNRASAFALGEAIFQRLLDHPEGAEVARVDDRDPLRAMIRTPDRKVRLFPEPIRDELRRAATSTPFDVDGERWPFILFTGERTRWNANTIQRDPGWRKGRGPHFAARLHPDDAGVLGVVEGDVVRIETSRGAITAPVAINKDGFPGQVGLPHGFGQSYPDPATGDLVVDGANCNELTDADYRDPFTGCPYHKHVPCRVERVASETASAA